MLEGGSSLAANVDKSASAAWLPGVQLPDSRLDGALRIVHFTDSLDPSGVGGHIVLLARELAERGHTQTLVCPDVPGTRALIQRCAALGMAVRPLFVRCASDAEDYARLVRLLRQGDYDLFHNHAGITWEGCWGSFAAADAGTPEVCTEHLPYLIREPEQRVLKARAVGATVRTIAVSAGVARTLIHSGVFAAGCVRVVWNGIDVARFSPHRQSELRKALLGIAVTTPLVLCVARLTPQKGHALLLEAVALARRRLPGLTLVLAGDGPLQGELSDQASQLGIRGAVLFLGRYPRVPELLRCADVLVQPSLFEGLPLAVLEAMASALPVVVTDVVGCSETVVPQQSGLVVPPDDPLALADALVKLLEHKEWAAHLGAAARRRAEHEFTVQRMAERTLAVYAEAGCAETLAPGRFGRDGARATPPGKAMP